MSAATDVMIDIESLGLRPDCAIIQIGAVLFEARSGGRLLNHKGFRSHVLVQDGCGTIDHSTVAWWLQERSAPRMGKALAERAVPLSQALVDLVEWLGRQHSGHTWESVNVWAKQVTHDLAALRMAFARFGSEPPWRYSSERCCRTLFSLAGGEPEVDRTGMTSHDALDDAVVQAQQVQMAMRLMAG